MKADFASRAQAISGEIREWRRDLHRHPELGFDLPYTTEFVLTKLRTFGYQPRRVGKAGIAATVGKPGKTFLLRADMDALPMKEESGEPFASQNGCMHACGHDMHTASLLAAAKMLKEREDELCGTVMLVFQPCEERMHGAQQMLQDGLFENGKPDAALAQHVLRAPTGVAGVRPGFMNGSCDFFKITLTGKGCHGASPESGVDPIRIAAHVILALEGINARKIAPDAMLVLTVCMVSAGTAPNILPDEAVLQGSIRTADPKVRAFVKKRVPEICEGIAASMRASCRVEYEGPGIPPMINDSRLLQELSPMIDDLLGEGTVQEIPSMNGSEDFSVFAEQVPGVQVWFGAGSREQGYEHGVHNPKVRFDEEALPQMAALYAECASRWLREHI